MMDTLPAGSADAMLALVIVIGMFALFLYERWPPEVTAMAGATLIIVSGVLPAEELLGVFSNSAPWTIAAMFVLTGGLVRTGALNYLSNMIAERATERPGQVLGMLALFVLASSAFMNNTPVVVMLIPVVVTLARKLGLSASKLLMPLSYTAILGGMCTLIGTSTNLLVDGVARERGLEPFTLFEVTPMAVILAGAGILYLRLLGPRLLPDRSGMVDFTNERKSLKFFTEVAIPEGSPVVGREVMSIDLFRRDGMRVIDVLRGDESLRRQFPGVVLQAGDRVVLRTGVDELLGLKESRALAMVDRLSSRKTVTVEALITPGCRLAGRTLGGLRLRRRYGVYPLAVHRRNQNLGRQLDDVTVRVGDTLLLEGDAGDIQRLAQDVDLVNVAEPSERPYRRDHAPVVFGTLAGVVGLATLGVAPIHVLALIGVTILLITRCIDSDEAFSFVDGRLMALIFSMLVVGAGLEQSGAISLVADTVAPSLQGLSPTLLILCVYGLTIVMTELVTNNAVAVVVTPVAIGLADALGVDPRPLVVAVMIAASASFATPIGYQTNTLVYGPGGYRFTDFVRMGLPLNLMLAVLSSFLIPVFWSF